MAMLLGRSSPSPKSRRIHLVVLLPADMVRLAGRSPRLGTNVSSSLQAMEFGKNTHDYELNMF